MVMVSASSVDRSKVARRYLPAWALVRASNTNPYLTLRFEGPSESHISEMKRVIYTALQRYPYVKLPE